MSKLTGKEPGHWHDGHGNHRMTDPRGIPGWNRKLWDQDERDYAAHLEAHEMAATNPQRADNDTSAMRMFFDLIEANEQTNEKLRAMIVAHRQLREIRK